MDRDGNYDSDDIIIGLDKNALPWVINNPTNRVIVIRNYDTRGMDEKNYDLKTDDEGQKYTEAEAEVS